MAYHKPAKPPVPLKLAPWEHATLPHPLPQGLLPAQHAGPLFLILAGVGMVLLNPTLGPWGIPVALVLARLLVLDVAAYVLPDVYTLPLLATGVVATALAQQWFWLAGVLAVFAALWFATPHLPKSLAKSVGIGGGDLKLLAAMALWLNPLAFCWAIAVGCLLWLPLVWRQPLLPVPLGAPLLVGWVIMLVL